MSPLNRRLRPLYATALLQGFVLWYAVEKLFMKSLGFSDQQVAFQIMIFTVIVIAVNIPAGILADRWSRKGVLALAGISLALGSLISGLSDSFWIYTIGACFWGLFYAFESGTYESVMYDTFLEETGKPDGYEAALGRLRIIESVGLVLSSFASSIVTAQLDLRYAYLITIPFALASVIAIWRFREPTLHKQAKALAMRGHLREMAQVIFKRGLIAWVSLGIVTGLVLSEISLEFDQLWLIALGIPLVLFGPVNALLLTMYGLGGYIAGKVTSQRRALQLLPFVALGALALFVRSLPVVIMGLCLLIALTIIYDTYFNKLLHDNLPSRVRSSAASIVGTAGSALFIPVAFAVGTISDRTSIFDAAWLGVVLITLLGISLLAVHGSQKRIGL